MLMTLKKQISFEEAKVLMRLLLENSTIFLFQEAETQPCFGHVKLQIPQNQSLQLDILVSPKRLRGPQTHSQDLKLDLWVDVFQGERPLQVEARRYPKAGHPCRRN